MSTRPALACSLCLALLAGCPLPPSPPDAATDSGGAPPDLAAAADLATPDLATPDLAPFDPECGAAAAWAPPAPPAPAWPPGVLALTTTPESGTEPPVTRTAWNAQDMPAVAFDGTHFLAVWQDRRVYRRFNNIDVWDLFAARIAADGRLLDPVGAPLLLQAAADPPALAYGGGVYLLVYRAVTTDPNRPRALRAVRVSTAGKLLDSTPLVLGQLGWDPYPAAVTSDGQNFLVAWSEGNSSGTPRRGVFARGVTPDGKLVGAADIALASDDSPYVAATYGGGRFAVTYALSPGGVSVRRLCPSGKLLDPVTRPSPSTAVLSGGVASNGKDFLVTWVDNLSPRAARVDRGGALLDSPAIRLSPSDILVPLGPVAWSGASYLVPLPKDPQSGGDYDLRVLALGADGKLADPLGAFVNNYLDISDLLPAGLTCQGGSCLLAFRRGWSTASELYYSRLGPGGALLDNGAAAQPGRLLTQAGNLQGESAVAGDGSQYLMVWPDDLRSAGDPDLYGLRYSAAGAPLDTRSAPVQEATGRQTEPSLSYTGSGYLLVWTDTRAGRYGDIYGARLSPTGAPLDATPIVISGKAVDEAGPSVACGGGVCLVLWHAQGTAYDVIGARVNPATGAVLDPAGIAVAGGYLDQMNPSVAYDGAQFLAAWRDQRTGYDEIYAARISTAGSVLDTKGVRLAPAYGTRPSAACGGGGCAVAFLWRDPASATQTVRVGRVSAAGVALDAGGIEVARAGTLDSPTLAYSGGQYLLAWADGRSGKAMDLYGARISTAGAVLDAGGVLLSGDPLDKTAPHLAAGPAGDFLLSYARYDLDAPYGTQRLRTRVVHP